MKMRYSAVPHLICKADTLRLYFGELCDGMQSAFVDLLSKLLFVQRCQKPDVCILRVFNDALMVASNCAFQRIRVHARRGKGNMMMWMRPNSMHLQRHHAYLICDVVQKTMAGEQRKIDMYDAFEDADNLIVDNRSHAEKARNDVAKLYELARDPNMLHKEVFLPNLVPTGPVIVENPNCRCAVEKVDFVWPCFS